MTRTAWMALCAIGALGIASELAQSAEPGSYRVVDGIALYIGFMPAEIIEGYPATRPERTMHGGVFSGRERTHVVVAAFDAETGQRITDAQAAVTVVELTGAETQVPLERMTVGGVISFGGYVHLPSREPVRLRVQLTPAGGRAPVEATFEHAHFGG